MTTNQNISTAINQLRHHQADLKEHYGVFKIGIFGSTVHGTSRANSDIDILVDFNRPIGFFKFIDLEDKLSQLLGRRVDLVTTKALKPIIKNEILKDVQYV